MNHDHPDPARLTFGCPACIQTVQADQRRDAYNEMSDDDLYSLWVSDPFGEDDVIIARLLMERSILSAEELDALGDAGVHIA